MPEEIQHPINAFPEYLQQIIYHYSEAKGYPTDFFIAGLLGAASTAMGRTVTLNTGNYTAIPALWIIILGLRGKVKSEPLDDAFAPLQDEQFRIIQEWQQEKQQIEAEREANPKAKIPDQKPFKKIMVNDTTPEKLVISLADNPKGCGIVYDELAGFVRRFNRYNAGADEEMYLSMFNGGSVMRDRISETNAYARRTYLSIIGTTQPSVLKEVFMSKIGKQYPNQHGINQVERDKYHRIIRNLLGLVYDENNYHQMSYTPTSYEIINTYQKSLIDIQNETESDDLRGVLAKMEIYLHRFCVVLQMLQMAITEDINDIYYVSNEAANGAVILTKYFIDQTQKVRISSPVESLTAPWDEIYRQLPAHGEQFSRTYFVRKCADFGLSERHADRFLKTHGDKSEGALFFKVKHGSYTKNLF
jgi:hypothetical protein